LLAFPNAALHCEHAWSLHFFLGAIFRCFAAFCLGAAFFLVAALNVINL